VCPGVVRLSCGAWYDPVYHDDDEPACAHGNANVLTRDHGSSRLSQGPSSATALVEVEKCTTPPPPVRAFAPVSLAAGTHEGVRSVRQCSIRSRTATAPPGAKSTTHTSAKSEL
jgi:hypothetical protein